VVPAPHCPLTTNPTLKKVHHWFGRLLLVAAVVNVFLGIWAINYDGVLLYVLFAIYLGLMLVLILVAEIYKCKKEK
jgi:formate hydrogenlyase subunit 4